MSAAATTTTAAGALPLLNPAMGPPGHAVFGHFRPFRDRTLAFFEDTARDYGDVVNLRFGPQRVVLINDPRLAEVVFHDQSTFRKEGRWKRLSAMLGQGLLTNEGQSWKHQRRMLSPSFHQKRLSNLAGMMAQTAQSAAERWATEHGEGEPFDINREMMAMALEIVVRALFNTTVRRDQEQINEAFTELQKHLLRRLWSFNPWTGRLPTRRNRRFNRALKVLDDVVLRIIAEHRRGERDKGDLLSMMLQVRDEDTGLGMSDQQIRDEVMTIILAGHETTANALSWSWLMLDRHPEVRDRLRAEALDNLGEDRLPDFEALRQMPYGLQTFKEAMRVYPPIWLIPRHNEQEAVVGRYRIPERTMVMVLPYLLHRHPKYWQDPELFDPDRFAHGLDAGRPRYAYMPFGAGPRTCLGQRFALMEGQIVLSTITRRFNIHVLPRHVEPQPLLSLRPRHGIPARLERV